ncbi:tail fiber domain-containing protein [Propionivibrio dicarboxylicus]|uniref:Chaperone of endosialidase n=1 Tax=Propionivibrio dicarboxylicus TaxID=83767 RepID=A0A1G8APA0_9RHOO|nr:glycosyl hydrolase family 28-related protein [Propionivibrio dicarboxylicus]SDH22713.1 Chaperone of endosialidase [Propionivibrio dicarboxylicus]
MTVATADAKAGPYTGNDSASSYTFEFKVFAETDIRVVETVIATGAETDLALNTNYTVTLNNDQDNDPGGEIVYKVGGATAALPSTKKLTIVGNFKYEQPTKLPNGGKFFAEIVETALDRCTSLIKQIKENVDRAIALPVSSDNNASDRAFKVVGFDSLGKLVLYVAQAGSSLIDLAASTGASLIGFIQNGTGAVKRWVQDKLREHVSVLDFGAVGDGTTDDTAAIQAAINSGKPIDFLGSGYSYKITSTVTYTGAVFIKASGATIKSDVLPFLITDGSGSRIIGRLKFLPVTIPYTLLRNTTTWTNSASDVVQSLEGYLPNSQDTDIWSSLSQAIKDQWNNFQPGGIYFNVSSPSGGSDVFVSGISGYQACVTLEGYRDSTVKSCTHGGRREAINFINGVAATNGEFTLPRGVNNSAVHNKVKYAAQCAIQFIGNDEYSAVGNSTSYNGESGIKTYQYDGSNSTGVICTNGIIKKNHVFNNYYDGIDAQVVYGSPAVDSQISGTIVSGNRCTNNRATGVTNNGKFAVVSGNLCTGNGSHGISVKGAHSTVTGNLARENTAHKSFWSFQIFDIFILGDGMSSSGNYVYNSTAPDTYNYYHSGLSGNPTNGLEGLDIGNRCSGGASKMYIAPNIPSVDTLTVGANPTNIGGAKATVRHGNGGGMDAGGATDGSGYVRVRGGVTNLGVYDFAKTTTVTNGVSVYDGRIAYDFNSTLMYFGINGGAWKVYLQDGFGLYPTPDNTLSLGSSGVRWTQLYAATATINTSDERQKQQIRCLSDAEKSVALRLKALIRAFKFNDAVESKGDKARWHVGAIAQQVKAAFEAEGLNAEDYAILCYDEWDDLYHDVFDEEGNIVGKELVRKAGNSYGLRYEELHSFILGAL